jgi:hypothetical protein
MLEVPREVPPGRTILAFTPVPDRGSIDRKVESATESAKKRATPHSDTLFDTLSQPTPISDSLLGILSDVGDITLEQIREERMAKHLK